MPLFLGIDAGGSKTACALADEHQVLARSTGQCAKVQRVGRAEAARNLMETVQSCVAKAGGEKIMAICIGVSGLSQPGIEEFLLGILQPLGAGRVIALGDHVIAHEAAFNGAEGILLISGTGSIAYGRNSTGSTARAGGHGPVVSDEGSGTWIGRAAVTSLLRARDVCLPAALEAPFFSAWSVASFDELIAKANAAPAAAFAALAPLVIEAAEGGDPAAKGVLECAAAELALLAERVRQQLWKQGGAVTVCGAGGVLDHSIYLQAMLEGALKRLGMIWSGRPVDPVLGAIGLARNPR